jgi:hypothetical protein
LENEKIKSLTEKLQPAFRDYINQRWGQLYELEKEEAEKALRYLFLVNSGGAIATLSFLAAKPSFIETLVVFSLLAFIVGVLLVGIAISIRYYCFSKLFEGWKQDVDHFYNKLEFNFEQLTTNDEKRVKKPSLDELILWLSFLCFISGCILGAMGLDLFDLSDIIFPNTLFFWGVVVGFALGYLVGAIVHRKKKK